MAPVIIISFADYLQNSLPALEEEFTVLQSLLQPLDAKEYIKLIAKSNTSLDSLTQTIDHYQDKIAIFHFSGHAAGEKLALDDGSAFRQGLARLLGNEDQLRFVFLNGCATEGHVETLFELGVKAVIATKVPVGDTKAKDFSIAFYRALVNKRTIWQAFQFAKGELELRYKNTPDIEVRAQGRVPDEEGVIPWGLYLQPGQDNSILHWRLPYYREKGLSDFLKQDINERVKSNQYIIKVLDRMCQVNKDIAANDLVQYRDGKPIPVDPSSYLEAIIKNFPWVIGSQIQLLQQKRQANRNRLEQLLSTYILTSQVLYYILLSDFWEQKMQKQWALPVGFTAFHFPSAKPELLQFDFSQKLVDIHQTILTTNFNGENEFFVPELAEFGLNLANTKHLLHSSAKYLQSLRMQLLKGQSINYQKLCEQAEKALTIYLSEAAFLADYHFLTVRNIYLDNARTRPLNYQFELGKLNATSPGGLGLYEDISYRRKSSYANCKSIVLTPSEKDFEFTLDLSPFIIDKNTFLGHMLPDPYLFGYSQKQSHYYFTVKHDLFTALENEKGMDIIHTEMTKQDFEEGRNDQSESEYYWDSILDQQKDNKKTEKAFLILEEQHSRFQSDFTPNRL